MKTTRFETFMDAVLAIIITVLVLKLPQPAEASWSAIWALNGRYMTYAVCFLIIFNTWYADHNLFQMVDEIKNDAVMVYGCLIFIISVIPYFATWVSMNPSSVPAQTMFGILFLVTNVLYVVSTYLVVRANPYNEKLKRISFTDFRRYVPIAIILIGFALTYTVYVPGIYLSCIISALYWFVFSIRVKFPIENTERFEALFDAIVAIILTVLVLEIPMVVNGHWDGLFELKLEFVAYIISFIVCFNFWNYNNNLFGLVNKVNSKVIWFVGAAVFVLSLIPYLSTFVAENFYSFVAQACYGIDFIIIPFLSILTSNALKEVDRGNIALAVALEGNLALVSMVAIVAFGMVVGYLFYPPAIICSCLVSIIVFWLISRLQKL